MNYFKKIGTTNSFHKSNEVKIKMKYFLLFLTILFLSNCSTVARSTWLGAGVGTVAGGLVGAAMGQNGSHEDQNKAIAIGAASGALVGGLIGNYAGNKVEGQTLNTPKLQSSDPQPPFLKSPVIRRIWIEDKIDQSGTHYETGHWLFLIERQSSWGK